MESDATFLRDWFWEQKLVGGFDDRGDLLSVLLLFAL
jgi:hypothetical protein